MNNPLMYAYTFVPRQEFVKKVNFLSFKEEKELRNTM